MYAYIALTVFILASSRLFNMKDKKQRYWYVLISCMALFFVMGFRDATLIGNDSSTSYLGFFHDMESVGLSRYLNIFSSNNFNSGFYLFMKICHMITGGDYQLFIIILSSIIMASFGFLINKYSISPLQSICFFFGLLFYTFMFAAEKQALSMAVLVFAFDAAIEKKPVRFIVLTILAGYIHFPAFIFLPVYILAQLNLRHGYLIILGVSLIITFIFRAPILKIMMDAYRGEEESYSLEGVAFLRNKVIIMIIIVIVALILRPIKDQNRLYKTTLLLMIFAINFQTFCGYNNIFERLADYFFYYSVIFIPLLFEFPKEGNHVFTRRSELALKWILPIITCSFAIWRFLSYVSNDSYLTPYRFFFSK